MEYEAIQSFLMVLLAICSSVVCIGGAIAAIVKFWKWAHKDTDRHTEEISEFKTWLASDKRRIEQLEIGQAEAAEINQLQLEALFTLLGHEIDGNHTAQLIEVRGRINGYLINKVGGNK